MIQILTKAKQTAQRLHILQKRKSGGLPYFTHLDNVARITAQYTSDPELIAAAYLHDTIEDTPYTPEELKQAFGERVASIVLAVTKTNAGHEGYLASVNTPEALLIAGSDKLDNSTDLLKVADWSVFQFSPAEKIRQYREVAQKVRTSWPELADRIEEKLSLVDKNINNPQDKN